MDRDYLDNLTMNEKIKLQKLINEMVKDMETFGGKSRIMDLKDVLKIIKS